MNKETDYSKILAQANQDLKQYNTELHVYDPGESGEYTIEIRTLNENGSVACSEDYASDYYIEELPDIITEAWAAAKKNALQIKRAERDRMIEETRKEYSLSDEAHLIAESIQEITLIAWPIIYGPHNEYDQDSRVVLETIREWGEEFEQWWMSHDEDWRDDHDYLDEIDKFSDRKCKEYLKELGVEPETIEAQIFDETGHLIAKTIENAPADKGHIEETIDVMLDIASIYEDRFADEVCDRDVERTLTKEWGREFAKWWYCDLSDEERMNRDYFADLEAFVGEKFKEFKEQQEHPAGVKEFIVHVTRTTTAELDLCVRAYREEDAVKQAETAMGRHDVVAEAITARANAKDCFETHQAYATEEHVDFYI